MLEVFGFTREPFLHELSPTDTFQWQDYREGSKRLNYALKCRGLVCLIGPSGSGKTTLLRGFVQQLPAELYKTLALHYTSGSSLDLLHQLAYQLGVDLTCRRARLVQLIHGECARLAGAHIHPLVVIDEAHYLAHPTLHDLRLLTTAPLDTVRHFTLVLSGHQELEARLRTSWLAPLRQRITTWVRLTALEPAETEQYLWHRLKIAGVPANLFAPQAVFALHQLASGLLRPLDRLAHHALIACALDGAKQVTDEHVRLAAEEVGL
jgi:general secretion pathway protein A